MVQRGMLVVVFPGFHFYRNNGQTVIVVDQEFDLGMSWRDLRRLSISHFSSSSRQVLPADSRKTASLNASSSRTVSPYDLASILYQIFPSSKGLNCGIILLQYWFYDEFWTKGLLLSSNNLWFICVKIVIIIKKVAGYSLEWIRRLFPFDIIIIRSYQKGGSPIGLSPYPARLKDFPRASATMRSRMPGDRCVAEDLGVPRAGKPNLRALLRPAAGGSFSQGMWDYFAIFVTNSKTVPMFETQLKMEWASLKLMRSALRGSDPCR